MMRTVTRLDGFPIFYEETDFRDEITHTKRTLHEFIKRREDGTRVRIPIAVMRVKNYSSRSPIFGGDETVRLNEHEIMRLFNEHKEAIRNA